jgi:O-antigen ligase
MEEKGAISDPAGRTLIATYGLFLSGYFFLPERSPLYLFYYLAVLLPFLPAAWSNRQDLLRSRLVVAALSLIAYLMGSALWSPTLTPGCLGFVAARGLLTASFLLVTVYLASRFPAAFHTLLKAVTLCAAFFGLVSMVIFYQKNAFPASRLVSFAQIDNSNTMGVVYGLFALLAMHFLLSAVSVGERSVLVLAAVVLLAVVVLTQSKNAFVATVTGLLALTSWRHGYRNLLVGMLLLAMLAALYGTPLAQRFMTDQDLSMGLRLEMWGAALGQISAAPLLGHGQCSTMQLPGGTMTFSHPHSIYLATAWYGGLLGLLLLVWVLVLAFRQALAWRKNYHHTLFLALLIYASIAISVDFDSLVTRPREPWLYFWLPLALLAGMTLRTPGAAPGPDGGTPGQAS